MSFNELWIVEGKLDQLYEYIEAQLMIVNLRFGCSTQRNFDAGAHRGDNFLHHESLATPQLLISLIHRRLFLSTLLNEVSQGSEADQNLHWVLAL